MKRYDTCTKVQADYRKRTLS